MTRVPRREARHAGGTFIAALLVCAALSPTRAPAQQPSPESLVYDVTFEARIVPTERQARVRWTLGAGSNWVYGISFPIDPKRHYRFRAPGELTVGKERVDWKPPARGGTLEYVVRIDSTRDEGGYDGRCAQDWALFRGSDLFPRSRVRTEKGARSRSELRLVLPEGWTSVTRYAPAVGGSIDVSEPTRRFDRPTGWMLVGKLGVLRERIAGSRIAIAGPIGDDVHRQDLLALLRWTLPELREIAGALPERLAIVSAGDPMWRGGLSGIGSVFVHADRPLIANDGTSPLLHEIFHAATRANSGPDGDWIVEGLAEYYSLELLVRSRTMSRARYERTLKRVEQRGRGATLRATDSHGAHTARAVSVLRRVDRQIRERTEDRRSLDDVVARLAQARAPITLARFREACEAVVGADLADFFSSLPRAR
ncbi:MAG TPA: hypothetical protein VEC18_01590 [Myxococcota bacterium]|nr:hypothetical protein [Myxococcota bacterium]